MRDRFALVQYLGQDPFVPPLVRVVRLDRQDRFLLATDGLTGPVTEAGIAQILAAQKNPSNIVKSLVSRAVRIGSGSNVSCIVVQVD